MAVVVDGPPRPLLATGFGTLNIEAGLERESDGEYKITGHRSAGPTDELGAALAAQERTASSPRA